MNSVIANVFSGLGAILLAYSTFSKKKDKMLWMQVGDCACNVLSNAFIGSVSAVTTVFICMIRNALNARGKLSVQMSYVFAVVIFAIGVVVNNKGLIGFVPPIASVEYTVWSAKCKTAQALRYALLVNVCLWFVYDTVVRLYPAMTMDVVVSVITVLNIVRYKRCN